ncbi:MAG: hypothetical protein ACYS6K_27290 [Planctomycetota bacterium]|jgi:hypothetical protein
MGTKRYIFLFLYVSVICVFAGSVVADTVIPYTLTNGWTYGADHPETLQLTENPLGGVIVDIDIPELTEEGGLTASRHALPGYSLHNQGFIQLEYSSLSSVLTGTPEGPSLCLEIEFEDAGNEPYWMGVDLWQDTGGYSLQTWFQSYDYETPAPGGLSVTEGALGFYSNGSLVFPYFIDAAGSVVSPLVIWDISGIIGTQNYRCDNDFEGHTPAISTITASVNLDQVVYGPGNPFTIDPLYGWVFMPPDVPDIGYSLDEGNLVYFYSSDPVLNYNITEGAWSTVGPKGWIYANWPFIYELDTGDLWFAWPPVDGLWVYHFSTSQWLISPRILP